MIKEFLINFIQHYGCAAIFISLALEYLGLPIPGETAMCFLGFLSWKSKGLLFLFSLTSSILGTFIGSNIAWVLGRKYGENILLKYGRFLRINKEKLDTTSNSFVKHKMSFILFGRYIPGIRHIVPYLSGISKMKFKTFFIYNIFGSIIWCTSFVGLGFLLGNKWAVAEKLIKAYSIILILFIVFIFVVIKFFNKHKKIIFAITLPMLLFIKLSEDLIKNELSVFDDTINKFVIRLFSEDMTELMRFITSLGSGLVMIIIALASIVIFWSWRSKKYFLYAKMLIVNLVAVSILNETFKVIFHRERPDILRLVEAVGFSFPSGHSMIGLSFYGLIAYFLYSQMKSKWKYVLIAIISIMIFSIGISRIYLGVHYASDVLAGFSAGLAWLAIFISFTNRIYLPRIRKNDSTEI